MSLTIALEVFGAVMTAVVAVLVLKTKRDHEMSDQIKKLWEENRLLREEVAQLRAELQKYWEKEHE